MFESTGSQVGKCMEELTISEVARRSGVRATTIRYYESINVLPEPRRANGRRRYEPAILDRLAFIHVAQRLGFSLNEIARKPRFALRRTSSAARFGSRSQGI